MKNLFLMLIAVLFSIGGIKAQLSSIPSPTAANIGLYGDIPVSYFTGTPQVSIPLYEIKGKQINIPIVLCYHPSAIRPETHPGPTGVGWSLMAGGVITRTVRGSGPDEAQDQNTGGLVRGYLTYAESTDFFMRDARWTTNASGTINNGTACLSHLGSAPLSDLEPDEFRFNFLGISGKFYFSQNGNIEVQSEQPLTVSYNGFTSADELGLSYGGEHGEEVYFNRMFKEFIITDALGNKYYFGGNEAIEVSDPIAYTRTLRPTGHCMVANSWFLTKVESADKSDIITFTYQRGPFVSSLYYLSTHMIFEGSMDNGSLGTFPSLKGSFISPVYLTEIKRSNGERFRLNLSKSTEYAYESFYYGSLWQLNGKPVDPYPLLYRYDSISWYEEDDIFGHPLDRLVWLKLDDITIDDMFGRTIRRICFGYDNTERERLFLGKLSIFGAESNNSHSPSSPLQTYRFKYKNRKKCARYLTRVTDHWGFDNGIVGSIINEDDRTPNSSYADNGVLDTLYYPTGGFNKFEYELNTYAKVVNTKNRAIIENENGEAGGIRIKKIESNDGNGHKYIREFIYSESPFSTVSSGILNVKPKYRDTISGYDNDGKYFSVEKRISYPIIPLVKENDGIYISYTDVCEVILSEGQNIGYTRYTYTNHDNGYNDVLLSGGLLNRAIFPTDPHCSRYFERGKLIAKQRFNAQSKLVYKYDQIWKRYNSRRTGTTEGENVRAFLFEGFGYEIGCYGYCSTAAYLHYVYKFLPESAQTTTYDANGENPVVSSTYFEYNKLGLQSLTRTVQSDGSEKGVNIYYLSDVIGDENITSNYGTCIQNADALLRMYELNMRGIPVEQVEWTKRNGITEYNSASYIDYGLFDNIPRPAAQHRFSTSSPTDQYKRAILTPHSPSSGVTCYNIEKDSRLEIEETYDLYDNYGNLLQHTDRSGLTTSYLWGDGGEYPVMQVVGDTYQNIFAALSLVEKANIQSGGYTSSQLQQVLSRIRSEYTNQRKTVQVSSYSHIPQIGLYSEVGSDGVSTNYRYDLIGRLRRILDHNLNVVKQYRYHYANHADDGDIDMGEPERMPYQEPIWELTGVEKCERNNNRLTGFITQEYKNINPAYTPADETIWLRDSARFGPRYCPSDYWWEQKGEVVHIHRSYIENKDDLNVRLNFKIKVTTPTGSEVGIYDYDVYFHNNLNEQKVIQDYYEYPGYNISIIEWCWIDGNGVRFLCSPPAPEPEPEPDRTPFWIATGEYECLKDSNDRNTGYASYRERDENPHSPTYNEYRIQARQSLGNCPVDSGLAKYSYTLVNPDRDPIIHLRRTFDDGRTAIFHIEVAVELGDGSIEKDQVEYRFYNSSETSSIHVVQIFHQLNAKRAWLTMNCWIEYR